MKKIFLIFVCVLLFVQMKASHIVGGSLTYICLGNDTYEFTLSLYRDCLDPKLGGGNPQALQSDDPAYISIYRGNSFYSFDSIFYNTNFTIPTNFSNDCINNPPATCLNRLEFKFIKTLPPSNQNYTIITQRCCRNQTINNIMNPGTTGASYYCVVPGNVGMCNNSAVFKNYPPQIICINNPFIYDHSANDPDGDSLVYYFCDAQKGADANDPKPILHGNIPSIQSVNYIAPYNSSNPLGGNPILKIDPQTGIITGTPNMQGRFVVNVCCDEYRSGQLINTSKREFQFVVTNCSKAVVANIPQFSEEANTYIVNCKSNTVTFKNQSTGGFDYHWDFGVNNISSDTSNLFEPTYTYPDTGTYIVRLFVNRGSTCPDSISRIVKIYPDFKTDFSYQGKLCPGEEIHFADLSTSTYGNVNFWQWNFDNEGTSSLQNPTYTFSNIGKDYIISLITGNKYGCRDTLTNTLSIPKVNIFAGNDTVIIVNTPFQFNGQGASQYLWTPPTYLDNNMVPDPNAIFPTVGIYKYTLDGVTANGCIGSDDINITVADGPYIIAPNAFTPNGDGVNDVFRIIAAGYKELKEFIVFSRWGAEVFKSKDFRQGWDGTYLNKPCEIGTYFWIARAVDINNKEQMVNGDINLIR